MTLGADGGLGGCRCLTATQLGVNEGRPHTVHAIGGDHAFEDGEAVLEHSVHRIGDLFVHEGLLR
ncbi:MAG: hypothetical protein VCE12_13105 [Candidatus Latescibacterota bacterium]